MKQAVLFSIIALFTIVSSFAQFTGSFNLVVTQHYKNGNETNDTLSYFFGKNKTALIVHTKGNEPDLRLVFSPTDSIITGLFEMNGEKGGYILPMNEKFWPGMQTALRDFGTGPRTKLKYSGDSKTIEGFETREVLTENDEYTARFWMPSEIELNMAAVLAYQSVGAGKSTKEIELMEQFNVEGLPLEMHLKSKSDKADVLVRVINISESFDESIFSTEGYKLAKVR